MIQITVEKADIEYVSWKVAWCTEHFSLLRLERSETNPGPYFLLCKLKKMSVFRWRWAAGKQVNSIMKYFKFIILTRSVLWRYYSQILISLFLLVLTGNFWKWTYIYWAKIDSQFLSTHAKICQCLEHNVSLLTSRLLKSGTCWREHVWFI